LKKQQQVRKESMLSLNVPHAVDERFEQRRSILTHLRFFIVAGSIALLFDY
jgi:hypothetical protein